MKLIETVVIATEKRENVWHVEYDKFSNAFYRMKNGLFLAVL